MALVNATLARQVFGDDDPIGRRIATGLDGPAGTWVTIVGVVADTPQENVAKATRPELYRPLAQDVRMGPSGLALVVRATGDPMSLAPALRREVAALRSDVAVSRVAPLAASPATCWPRRARRRGCCCSSADSRSLLAALGLYGVVSCLVGETTRELGVRLALGAEPRSLVALVLRRSLALAGLGLAVGLAAALALGRLLEGLLFGISPRDPLTLGVVSLVLLLGRGGRGLRARSPRQPARSRRGCFAPTDGAASPGRAPRSAGGARRVRGFGQVEPRGDGLVRQRLQPLEALRRQRPRARARRAPSRGGSRTGRSRGASACGRTPGRAPPPCG